jgi:type IV fimbrial biogenesis protein FimT
MSSSRHRGFTLMELMVVLALTAILLTLAVPSMRDFMRNGRLATAANDLLHAVSLARTEAIKRQAAPGAALRGQTVVCASADPNAPDTALACSYGAMSGWIAFVDANSNGQFDRATDTVLERGAASSQVTVKSDNAGIVCFDQTGFQPTNCGGQAPTRNVVICDVRGNQAVGTDSTARAVLITRTGRARVSRVRTDVSAALAAIGASCP